MTEVLPSILVLVGHSHPYRVLPGHFSELMDYCIINSPFLLFDSISLSIIFTRTVACKTHRVAAASRPAMPFENAGPELLSSIFIIISMPHAPLCHQRVLPLPRRQSHPAGEVVLEEHWQVLTICFNLLERCLSILASLFLFPCPLAGACTRAFILAGHPTVNLLRHPSILVPFACKFPLFDACYLALPCTPVATYSR